MKYLSLTVALAGAMTAQAATPTYNHDIAPILYKNCATCHRPGEVAPFPLLTYQDAAKRAKLIATVTEKRYMPPWKAEPGYGHFQNERRLTDAQIAMLHDWAAQGAPEGNPAEKPVPPTFTEGWQTGQPDKIFQMPAEYSIPADGPDQYRCFVIPMNLDQDAYIHALEFRPGNRRVVHHAIVFTDPTGASAKLAGASGSYPCFGGPGFAPTGIAGGWAPGQVPTVQASNAALTLKKGANLVLQIHYHPSGKPEMDRSSLGLHFGTAPTVGRGLMLINSRKIDIPAGDAHYVVKADLMVPRDVELLSLTPHAHYLCRDMKVTATFPDGTSAPLIWIKDWDFNWQGNYRLATPMKLPQGTRIELEYTYDNSSANPRNPRTPPVRVHWGEQTTDEMAVLFMGVGLPTPADEAAFQQAMSLEFIDAALKESPDMSNLPREISPAAQARLRLALRLFDRNHDGKLDDAERAAFIDFLRQRQQR